MEPLKEKLLRKPLALATADDLLFISAGVPSTAGVCLEMGCSVNFGTLGPEVAIAEVNSLLVYSSPT